jgi:hypothetical protein
LTELAMLYIQGRLPDLSDGPCPVPSIRAASKRKKRPLLEHANAN